MAQISFLRPHRVMQQVLRQTRTTNCSKFNSMHQFQFRKFSSNVVLEPATKSNKLVSSFRNGVGTFKAIQQLTEARLLRAATLATTAVTVGFRRHPLLLGTGFACSKAILADLFAQKVIEGTKLEDLNMKRIALFGTLGIFYNGLCVYMLYAKLYPTIFATIQHWKTLSKVLAQSVFDVFFHATFLYFPLFYGLKACIFNGFSLENVKEGLEEYFTKNMLSDFKSTMMIWFPCNLVAFGYIPTYLRTPYMSMISFFWVVCMSATRASSKDPDATLEMELDAAMGHPRRLEEYFAEDDDEHAILHAHNPFYNFSPGCQSQGGD